MKPRILFFLPGLSMGGAERQTLDLLFGLRAWDYETRLLVFGPMRSEALLGHLADEDYVQLDANGMLRPLGWWRAFHALRRLDADIVVAVNQTPAVLATFLRPLLRKTWKAAIVFHTTTLPPNEKLRHFLFEWATALADAFVFVSRNQADYWRRSGLKPKRQTVVLNGIDLARFDSAGPSRREARTARGLEPSDFVFGSVAAFRPWKGHLDLVRAFRRVAERNEAARLVLVGDGATRPAVEQEAARLGIAEKIVFAGEQSDVRPWLATFDVGLLCSRQVETFSLAAIETLASGVPMIMSDIGGAGEIVRDGENGFLAPAGDEDALVDAMLRIMNPPVCARLSAAARPSVAHLSREAMIEGYAAEIDALLGRAPA